MSNQQDIALNGFADFELPKVESSNAVRKVHVGGSVCESCEG